jgi:hypothetical protein
MECKKIFAYFMAEYALNIRASDTSKASLAQSTKNGSFEDMYHSAKENGIQFVLDAQDDAPPNNTECVLLEMGRSPNNLTIYLVLVRSPISGQTSLLRPPSYRRIGLCFHQVTRGYRRNEDEGAIKSNYISTNPMMGQYSPKSEQLCLI